MGVHGGLAPYPERYGAGSKRLERILRALNNARGTAYDTSQTSNVYAENMALARALDAAWSTNQRLANQWDPERITTSLARWEKILGLHPYVTDTDAERRARIADRLLHVGVPKTHQEVYDRLHDVLGADVFVAVRYIDINNAVRFFPGSIPAGPEEDSWYATIAHILVHVQKPDAMTEGEFYEKVKDVHRVMDAIAPAWATWDWYRNGEGHSGLWAEDAEAGFFLDDDHNLDNQIFDL